MATTTRSTVVAVYRNRSDAHGAAAELQSNGFKASDIYISAGDAAGAGSGGAETRDYLSHRHHEGGITGWFKSLFGHTDDDERNKYENAVSSGNVLLSVETDDQSVDAVGDILDRFNPIDIHREDTGEVATGATAAASTGPTGTTTAAGTGPAVVSGTTAGRNYSTANQTGAPRTVNTGTAPEARADAAGAQAQAIPVVQEELKVGKRRVLRGGVRVYSRIVEQPVEENVRLREEKVRVDRERADRPLAPSDLRRDRDQVIEVQEYAEEPVISKEARVVEEVRVQKDATERNETIRDTVRRTEVRVEGISAQNTGRTGVSTQADFDADYRRDFETNYASSGANYDEYAPAYRYGYEIANDPRYRDRRFDEIESDLRADYGRRYPNNAWDRFKNAVRYGWDSVTGRTRAAASSR